MGRRKERTRRTGFWTNRSRYVHSTSRTRCHHQAGQYSECSGETNHWSEGLAQRCPNPDPSRRPSSKPLGLGCPGHGAHWNWGHVEEVALEEELKTGVTVARVFLGLPFLLFPTTRTRTLIPPPPLSPHPPLACDSVMPSSLSLHMPLRPCCSVRLHSERAQKSGEN